MAGLVSDVINYGRCAMILHNYKDGSVKAIAYASRTLLFAEKNYSQIDKKTLTIILAVHQFHK